MSVSQEDTLNALKEELFLIGSTKIEDYDKLKSDDQVFSNTICRRLKLHWSEVIFIIGLSPPIQSLSKYEMVSLLENEFERLGCFEREFYKMNRIKRLFPHPRVLTDHLGMTWVEIIERCGCTDINEDVMNYVSDEELIKEYRLLCKKMKYFTPTVEEMKEHLAFPYMMYIQHFGSLEGIREASRFKFKPRKIIITKQECIEELTRIYKEYGRVSIEQVNAKSSISYSTFCKRFNTTMINRIWDEVLESEV